MVYMDRISSSDFRKIYIHLDRAVKVTALGRVIGTWTPAGADPEPVVPSGGGTAKPAARPVVRPAPKVTGTTGIAAMGQGGRDRVLGRLNHPGA